MDRYEFLKILSDGLISFPEKERNEILYDYEEHFRVGGSRGKSDSEIIMELGDPYMIVAQYKYNYSNNYTESKNTDNFNNSYYNSNPNYSQDNDYYKNKKSPLPQPLKIVVLVAIIVTCLPVIGSIVSFIIGLYGTSIGLVIGGIGMMLGGITGSIASSFIYIPASIPLSALILVGIGTICLGILLFIASLWVTRFIYSLILKLIKWLKTDILI